ncbi:hypothetical protein [Actinomadura sp. 3N508]
MTVYAVAVAVAGIGTFGDPCVVAMAASVSCLEAWSMARSVPTR